MPVPKLIGSLACLLALTACATVPGTERSQLMLLPLSVEVSLGLQSYQQSLAEAAVVQSGPDHEMVQRVGSRIAEAATRLYPDPSRSFEWEIVLLDDPQTANAWALPGGKMAVYSGLLPITGDEESLAVVVGHEVAHAVARHGGERMSQGLVFELLMVGAEVSMDEMDPETRQDILAAMGAGGTVGVMLPFSRKHESEADHLGLLLAGDAGYDPRAAIGLWERMASSHGGARPPEFLSTHPSEQTRIERLQEVMPHALELYEAALRRGS